MKYGSMLPGTQVESVQLTDMPDPVPVWRDDALEEKWTALIQVRDEVNKALEQARRDKVVGNSLGAHVELYPDENTRSLLGQFEDLETLFIVSKVTIHDFNARPKDAKDFAIRCDSGRSSPGRKMRTLLDRDA